MKSIDKLRTSLKACTKEAGVVDKFDTYWITADACDHLIDEIESEIADNYMRLPVDADGVPIHVGDEMVDSKTSRTVVAVAPKSFMMDGYENGSFYRPGLAKNHHHAKPRTLEDVLVDMLEAAVGYSDAHTDVSLVAIEKYADEIRELLGFEIDEPDTIRNELENNGLLGGDE